MDRMWQWAWDRYGARYTWALCVIGFAVALPIYLLLLSFPIVAFEKSGHYVEVAVVTVVAIPLLVYIMIFPGRRSIRPVEHWAAGHEVDRMSALKGTYSYARRATTRTIWATGVWAAVLAVTVGAIAGATWSRLVQYGILGAVVGIAVQLIAFHNIVEAIWRPARVALAGDTGIGDSLPRSRPTFAARSNVSVVAVAFAFALDGALLAAVFHPVSDVPLLSVVIGCALALGFAVPISVGIGFSPSLQPIRDLGKGAERVAASDYSQRLPVVQDDDLGALAASFNRMQSGLAERQRLQVAFGTYVDPALAARLLRQGDHEQVGLDVPGGVEGAFDNPFRSAAERLGRVLHARLAKRLPDEHDGRGFRPVAGRRPGDALDVEARAAAARRDVGGQCVTLGAHRQIGIAGRVMVYRLGLIARIALRALVPIRRAWERVAGRPC